MKNSWKKLSSKIVHQNPWYQVREDKIVRPDGQHGSYFVIKTKGPSVFIVPLTSKNEVYLIKLYRYTSRQNSWEIPGGNSEGEEILTAAKRELMEETGLIAKTWKRIGTFQAMNGIVEEPGNVFIARDISMTGVNDKTGEGITDIKRVPFKKVLGMIAKSEITDAHSIVALTHAWLYLKEKS